MNRHMKWWGWGDPQHPFTVADKPALWPYIVKTLGLPDNPDLISSPAVSLEEVALPEPRLDGPLLRALEDALAPSQITSDRLERIVHSYGKSFRDLWRIRRGIVSRAPDCICYPESEEDVARILALAQEHDAIVIPFGGGSNIAGCLEAIDGSDRMVISLDLQRMNRVLEIDSVSRVARIQPGILGPQLEQELNKAGMTLGHFPDSFQFSTLGGWVATRSAGMQSDKYGKIEDMVIALRMVTPQGTIVTRQVPKSSNGIDVRHLCIGSEGILGVITELTMQVHPLPEVKEYGTYLFADFEEAVGALYECAEKKISPSMTRLNDAMKTALSFAFKTKKSRWAELVGRGMKRYLRSVKKMDLERAALLLVCFEGTRSEVRAQKKAAGAVYRKYGAVSLGKKPGQEFSKTKYDFPYIRDFIMDRGVIADVSETSTCWANLIPLYRKAREAIVNAMGDQYSFCGCHISHTYHTGASLYFTFVCKETGAGLEQYLRIKQAAEDAFLQFGGTLSHHHAVGYEHRPWIEQEISCTGIEAVKALKQGLDPKQIMNPGKIIPCEHLVER